MPTLLACETDGDLSWTTTMDLRVYPSMVSISRLSGRSSRDGVGCYPPVEAVGLRQVSM